MRAGVAPSAVRIAISRRRALAGANSRLVMFTEAISRSCKQVSMECEHVRPKNGQYAVEYSTSLQHFRDGPGIALLLRYNFTR